MSEINYEWPWNTQIPVVIAKRGKQFLKDYTEVGKNKDIARANYSFYNALSIHNVVMICVQSCQQREDLRES